MHLCAWWCAELSNAIASAEKSLKFLEQTIVMVEANRSKFEHIDNVRTVMLQMHIKRSYTKPMSMIVVGL